MNKILSFIPTLFTFFLVFVSSNFVKADNTVDSLYQLVEGTDDVEEKVEQYYQLLKQLYKTGNPLISTYLKELEDFAKKENSIRGKAYVASMEGIQYQTSGNPLEAIKAYNKAKELYSKINENGKIVSTIGNLARSYMQLQEFGKAEKFLDEGLEIAKLDGNEEIIGDAYVNKARFLNLVGKYGEAREMFDKAISIFRSIGLREKLARSLAGKGMLLRFIHDNSTIITLQNALDLADELKDINLAIYVMEPLGQTYLTAGRYKEAIELSNRLLKFAEIGNQYNNLIKANRMMGMVYSNLEDKEKTKEFYGKCIKLSKERKDTANWQYANTLLGFFLSEKAHKEAKPYLEESLDFFTKTPEVMLTIEIFNNLAEIYLKEGDLIKAKSMIDASINLNDNRNEKYLMATYNTLGEYFIYMKEYDKSKQYLNKVYSNAEKEDYLLKLNSSWLLYKSYKHTNQVSEALSWLEIHSVLKDSLSKSEESRRITSLLLKEEFKKEKEVIALQQTQEKELLKAETKQTQTVATGIGLLALLVFAFWWNARNKNKTISQQNAQLEQLNVTKDRIFALIGHDLRKPAIGFRNVTKKVNYLLKNEDYSTLSKLGDSIEKDALALNKLTDNLLHWALTQKNVMPYNPTSLPLREVTNDVLAIFEPLAKEKMITINNEISEDLEVFADLNSLQAIIRNLVDNGIKYSNDGGTINLAATTTDKGVKIEIADNGIGIEENELREIFLLKKEKSKQGTKGEKGTGLGLHLVQELVKLNKGLISVKSQLGLGTNFELVLPART